ncbi:MAG: hypothetical protein KJ007_08610 [Burkholderiales bacterium]|nr:hypothetical protein [Burkholderiales bacterium]
MASYPEWNEAFVAFLVSGVRHGAPVYLTIDDDSLVYVGAHYLGLPAPSARDDFIAAVKERCTERVGKARRVNVGGARGVMPNGTPNSVSFLAAMVLAAHEMRSDEEQGIDGTNYFRRFAELLDLSPGTQSRPLGFATGEEEGLWQAWNAWLAQRGYKPTAQAGEGAHVYIAYPIEQALVRKDDREFLELRMRRAFSSQHFRMLDEAQLATWLMRQGFGRRHLQAGLHSADPDRASAFVDAAFRIYQAIDWDAEPTAEARQGSGYISLTGGILRRVSIRGIASYLLMARRPSRWKSVELRVVSNSGAHTLVPMRADLFAPLWPVEPFVEAPLKYVVEGDPLVESLVFPRRDFWILTTDPEDPLGQMGTWERYPNLLGRKFWILLKSKEHEAFRSELEKYRSEKLIDWDSQVDDPGGWAEYRGCMVLSRAWDCIVPATGTESLYDSLRPTSFANIGLSGGIRAPEGQGWLEGYPPTMTIYGFERVLISAQFRPSIFIQI